MLLQLQVSTAHVVMLACLMGGELSRILIGIEVLEHVEVSASFFQSRGCSEKSELLIGQERTR